MSLPDDLRPGENMGEYMMRHAIQDAHRKALWGNVAAGMGFAIGVLAIAALVLAIALMAGRVL
jgi:hypothetical protein